MFSATATPDEVVNGVLTMLRDQPEGLEVLEGLPDPVYTTDGQGRITWFNQACVDFAGRTPELGRDSWCVTFRLYTPEGEPLPHEQCPMAVAIQQGRPVRGAEAVAERPDGRRIAFRAYPTPLLDEGGAVAGAVNLLLDISGGKEAESLKAQALRCRRLARSVNDAQTMRTLVAMADEYEMKARELRPD